MKYIVCALAMTILAGSSCKDKPETKIPEIIKEQPVPEGHHPAPGKGKHHGKWIPPGHAKKMHGAQSARDYTPGHNR